MYHKAVHLIESKMTNPWTRPQPIMLKILPIMLLSGAQK